jgi:hypothetical protein
LAQTLDRLTVQDDILSPLASLSSEHRRIARH